MRRFRFFFMIFIFSLFLYFFFLTGKLLRKFNVSQTSSQNATPSRPSTSSENPFSSRDAPKKISFHGTTYSVYSGNEKLWEIQAKTVKGNSRQVKAFQITGVLYRKEKPSYEMSEASDRLRTGRERTSKMVPEVPYFHFQSPVAFLDFTTGNLIFPEGTGIHGENGEKMFIRYLTWDSLKEKFFGSKGVEVIQHGSRLQGEKLEWGKPFTVIRIQGNVKGNTKS